jgi:hypothetical protein
MGDISEMRGLIVCVTFIATAVTLILIVPTEFYPVVASQYVNPSQGDFRDIMGYNVSYYWNFTGNYLEGEFPDWHPARGVTDKSVKIGGYTLVITESWFEEIIGNVTMYHWELQMEVCDEFWDYRYNREDFTWINQNGTDTTSTHNVRGAILGHDENHSVLTLAQLDIDSRSTHNNTYSPETRYTVRCSKTTFHIIFNYNVTAFDYPTAAYEGVGVEGRTCGLSMSIGQDFSERSTQLNAWTLITGFLFFQLIPDLPVVMSLLIEAPMWIAEAYLLFIFALRVIGAVFGGGGA